MERSIFLVGFMGAGKTTLGKKLAARLQLPFTDLDQVIATTNGAANVQQLVDEKGIEFFRQAESDCLKQLPAAAAVVSTGGGAPCYFDNLRWMKQSGLVVYLQLDEKSLHNRLKQTDLSTRPLLRNMDDEDLQEFIHEKLIERNPFYKQAHIIFNPVKQDIEELLKAIETWPQPM